MKFGFMYEEMKKLIKSKKENIDEETLTYFTNYFYVMQKDKINPSVEIESFIDNALNYASKVEFYDENHNLYKKFGGDVKGYRDSDTKTIFIRDNLEEPLREITVYHELHHAVQTNPENDRVGINQESNIGRLIMEGQTQYFAEKVYQEIHGVKFDERQIPSENLRMLGNGTVVSSLHNYEMYDNLLSKLAIVLGVSKDYFVSINYLYKDNEGLKDLEKRYNEAREKYHLPYNFNSLLLVYDYIYYVDLLAYMQNKDKEVILSGQETQNAYEIHPNQAAKLSLKTQRNYLNNFDVSFFLALMENGGNCEEFCHYIVDNDKRAIVEQYIGKKQEKTPSTPKKVSQ